MNILLLKCNSYNSKKLVIQTLSQKNRYLFRILFLFFFSNKSTDSFLEQNTP